MPLDIDSWTWNWPDSWQRKRKGFLGEYGCLLLELLLFLFLLWLLMQLWKRGTNNMKARPMQQPSSFNGVPGIGKDASFREIIQSFLDANVPASLQEPLTKGSWQLVDSNNNGSKRKFILPKANQKNHYWQIYYNPRTDGWCIVDPVYYSHHDYYPYNYRYSHSDDGDYYHHHYYNMYDRDGYGHHDYDRGYSGNYRNGNYYSSHR